MSWHARIYCGIVITAGVAVLAHALSHLQTTDRVRMAVYLLSAAVLATMKLRVPGLKATVSGACVVIFTGVAGLSISETVLIGVATGIGQCLWRPLYTPRPVQVVFSIATLVISSAVTFRCYHWLGGNAGIHSTSVLIFCEAGNYFLTNTALIAGVLAVTEIRPPMQIWTQLYLWTFPHYVIFSVLGSLINDASPNVNWLFCLAAMPVILMLNHKRMSRVQATAS